MPADQQHQPTSQPEDIDDDSDRTYTLSRIDDAIQLARELSCSQDAAKAVVMRVIVDQCGENSRLVFVSIEDHAE